MSGVKKSGFVSLAQGHFEQGVVHVIAGPRCMQRPAQIPQPVAQRGFNNEEVIFVLAGIGQADNVDGCIDIRQGSGDGTGGL